MIICRLDGQSVCAQLTINMGSAPKLCRLQPTATREETARNELIASRMIPVNLLVLAVV